jgi:proteasome lid subunit RPN8/RPN11
LVVTSPVAEALVAACDHAFPLEAAGCVLGVRSDCGMVATDMVLSRAAAAGHGAFEIADHEVHRIKTWAAARDLRILALFHSHPSGSVELSTADRNALKHSEWPWLVVAHRPRSALKLALYRPGDATRMLIVR